MKHFAKEVEFTLEHVDTKQFDKNGKIIYYKYVLRAQSSSSQRSRRRKKQYASCSMIARQSTPSNNEFYNT